MDHLLLPYLRAIDESERQEPLDELILVYAAAPIRHMLREKLGYHVDQHGTNASNQDAEDPYQETRTKITHRLDDLRASARGRSTEPLGRKHISIQAEESQRSAFVGLASVRSCGGNLDRCFA